MLTATLGKLARDVALLAQSEVGEAFEPPRPAAAARRRCPQKRNPVAASMRSPPPCVPHLVGTMLAAAVQEHERGLGNWPAEWDTLPEIVLLAAGALDAMAEPCRARRRSRADARELEQSQGTDPRRGGADGAGADAWTRCRAPLVRDASRARCGKAALEGRARRRSAGARGHRRAALERLFDPANYLGATNIVHRSRARRALNDRLFLSVSP
jgi:3-carboxy-cis,cis-muconate cycloisomerase